MLRYLLLSSLGLAFVAAAPAQGQGLVDLHEKVRVGGKLCMKDHYHDGNSSGHKSRKEAELAAVRSWQDFTGWEYGSAWGSFWHAASRGIKCDKPDGTWTCHVQARPCRKG